MSSRPSSTAASRAGVAVGRRSATSAAGSAVAAAGGRPPNAASARRERASAAPPRAPAQSAGEAVSSAAVRRLDRGGTRPIAVAARASLSQGRSPSHSTRSGQRSPRVDAPANATARAVGSAVLASSPTPVLAASPGPFEVANSTLDDESLALALASEWAREEQQADRNQDEALALALAREQEAADADALAAAMAVSGGRANAPMPWQLDDGLAAMMMMAAGAGPAGLHGVDPMSLQDLLGFSSQPMAAPEPRGPSIEQISRLPTRRVTSEDLARCDEEEQECPVCFSCYAEGDELRTLPCMHSFHVDCIDRWLTSGREAASTCPVCHSDVNH